MAFFNDSPKITFTHPSGEPRPIDFSAFSEAVGPAVAELASSLFRIYGHREWATQKVNIYALKAFLRYHATHYPSQAISCIDINEDYFLAYAQWLRGQDTWRETTKEAHYGILMRLVAEIAARKGFQVRIPQNQFPRSSSTKRPKKGMSPAAIEALLAAARREAGRIYRDFKSSRDGSNSELALVREVASKNGGFLPRPSSLRAFKPLRALFDSLQRSERADDILERWDHSLFPNTHSLLPFFLLISYDLAANPESLLEMTRDCLSPAPDVPILSGLTCIDWSKRRSSARQYQFRGSQPFAAPSLINQVLEMTEPLVPMAEAWHRDRLFLYLERRNEPSCRPFTMSSATKQLKAFAKEHCAEQFIAPLQDVRFDMIRPTRLTLEYLRTGNIFRVNRLANHRYLNTTARYIANHFTADRDDAIIAEVQTKLANRSTAVKNTSSTSASLTKMAVSRGFICKDPFLYRSSRSAKRCPNWLRALFDDSLVIPNETRYVARLLQAREHLRNARLEIDAERFASVYADALCIIESDILPRFPPSSIQEATSIVHSLSPMPALS